jgi:hypothetical protein
LEQNLIDCRWLCPESPVLKDACTFLEGRPRAGNRRSLKRICQSYQTSAGS